MRYQAVMDPLGRMVTVAWGMIDNGQTAVIEMAAERLCRLLKIGLRRADYMEVLLATIKSLPKLIKIHSCDHF